MKIILASASPRRRELLGQIGLEFEVRVSHVEENVTETEPGLLVEELSRQKAWAVLRELAEAGDVLVIGADTVVWAGGRILGKPSGKKDAERMLGLLSGRSHEVYTGVTLLYRTGEAGQLPEGGSVDADRFPETERGAAGRACAGRSEAGTGGTAGIGKVRCRTFHEMTRVSFYPMAEEEISGYAASGDCMDKAGAYGIQGLCARYIRGIEGDYNNVVGLPVGRLYQELFEEIKEWMRDKDGEKSGDF